MCISEAGGYSITNRTPVRMALRKKSDMQRQLMAGTSGGVRGTSKAERTISPVHTSVGSFAPKSELYNREVLTRMERKRTV